MDGSQGSETKKVVNESGIEIEPLYTAEDVERSGGVEFVGDPGGYPFTRGIHKEMYRKRPWTMRQYAGFGNPVDTNQRFKYLIENGQTGLNVAFDLPTQTGLDSDNVLAEGEVGRVGMAIDSLRDFEIAFDGIDLEKITVSLTVNGSAAILIAMYLAMAEKRGYDIASLRGTAQNDILKEFIGRGTWVFPVEPSIKLVGDTIEFCAEHAPKYSPVSVCGYHIRESGCNPAEEMAYAFCIAKAYADDVIGRGLNVDEFAGRLSYNFNLFGNIFEQVAKFRAGRGLWAKIVKEDYGAEDPRSMWLRMIAGGGGGGLTFEQPEVNIMRGAYYALISALSGTQTMALCSYDEAYTIPTEYSARISLRTMQLLIDEMGLCDTVDPLAGSYYVETLTNQMRERMEAIMAEVDAEGGIVEMVKDGRIQAKVSKQAYGMHRDIESGAFPKVGVNRYRIEEDDEHEVEFHPYNKEDAELQIESLRQVRSGRAGDVAGTCLAKIKAAAEAGENVMPAIMEAVQAYATVGEITDALVEVYGRYQEPIRF
ncbi:MAG: methylmalonyl-CoA mutase family protein [Rhodospirillales bacterium]|jgi:methylmalonyl-CoA mutase N-terminal domain/subunit|nr:methylmalonyl-CoA mutase [Rhodospirillaceae bacterium]MDP6428198.1 methylmalonyl-CoA mutase family protein [Rhodospirillales bacterium]MDP6642919.1 methylmalonyl-CoA mutase family protein [Rhodospirillales bacterium]MDP6841466.1 methylmalonyl-CoA mutase family protein [Rhodospirillales bacterium]|tara:strand:+ start:1935 stop:3548 length:1614 start_codon:yes stop_codon:yes gene_type:complete